MKWGEHFFKGVCLRSLLAVLALLPLFCYAIYSCCSENRNVGIAQTAPRIYEYNRTLDGAVEILPYRDITNIDSRDACPYIFHSYNCLSQVKAYLDTLNYTKKVADAQEECRELAKVYSFGDLPQSPGGETGDGDEKGGKTRVHWSVSVDSRHKLNCNIIVSRWAPLEPTLVEIGYQWIVIVAGSLVVLILISMFGYFGFKTIREQHSNFKTGNGEDEGS